MSRSPDSCCGSLRPTLRALSGLLAPGAGASQHTGASAATAATGLRRLFQCFSFFSEVSGDPLLVLPDRPPVLLRVLVGSVAAAAVARAKTAEWPRASTAWRRWRWRRGDRPSYLSGPRRKKPRSAAERLLALETKFVLFWVGQERDSVLSRSSATPSDCSGLHERNLPVATLWPSPTSGTLGGRRFRAEKGGGNQVGAAQGPLRPMEGSNQAGPGRGPLGPMEGSNRAGGGHGP